MHKQKIISRVMLVTILFVFPTFLGLLEINKDRPKTYVADISNNDDGVFTHNARNKALFGRWILENDDWNPIFQYPLYTYVWYTFFNLFGVGFAQGRLPSVIFGLLSLIFFYKAVSKGYNKKIAVIATIFLGYNFILIMYNSSMMVEAFMIFFIVLSFYFWEIAIRKYAYLLLVGFFCFLAIIAKPSSFWFLGTCIFSLLPILITGIRKRDFILVRKVVAYFSLGLITCVLLYLFIFFIPHFDLIKLNLMDNQIKRITGLHEWSKPPVPFLYKIVTMPFNTQFFVRNPIISLFAFIYLIYFVTNLTKDFKKSDYMDFFVLNWIFFMFVFFVLFHNPIRREIAMTPALAVFSAIAVVKIKDIFGNKNKQGRFRTSLRWLLALMLTYMLLGNIIMYGFKNITSIFHPILLQILSNLNLRLPPFRSNALDAAISSLFAITLTIFIILFIRAIKLDLAIAKKIKIANAKKITILFILIIISSIFINIGQYVWWLLTYEDSMYRASKELGKILPENTKVYGDFTPGLAMENKIISVYFEAPLMNYKNRFERDDIRYVLIILKREFSDNRKEVEEWKEHYPNMKLMRVFYINDAEGTEIGLFDKFPKGEQLH